MKKDLSRESYLQQLQTSINNGLVKILQGVKGSGKSYFLHHQWKNDLYEKKVQPDHIIEVSFDEDPTYRDPEVFFHFVQSKIQDDKTYYLLLDEITYLKDFIPICNSFINSKQMDLYLTTSLPLFNDVNLQTEFAGRYTIIPFYPLTFHEFLDVYDGHFIDGLQEYMIYGGLPRVVFTDNKNEKEDLLKAYLHDQIHFLIDCNHIKNTFDFEVLFNILTSFIGKSCSPYQLQQYGKKNNFISLTNMTIQQYLHLFKSIYLINTIHRYDIKQKVYTKSPMIYYGIDVGLCNASIQDKNIDQAKSLINIIYNELCYRGLSISSGFLSTTYQNKLHKLKKSQFHIDFICSYGSKKYYIQTLFESDANKKLEDTLFAYSKIEDHFKKMIITLDPIKPHYNEDGIFLINVYDFLLDESYLNW